MFVGLNDPPDEAGLHWIEFGPQLVLGEVIIGAQCPPGIGGMSRRRSICTEAPLNVRGRACDGMPFCWSSKTIHHIGTTR